MFDILIRSLNALLMIALPLILGVFLYRKLGVEWRLFGIGMMTFITSQVFHIPFNIWVLNPAIARFDLDVQVAGQLLFISLLAGLSAGVFEEVARFVAFRLTLRQPQDRTWDNALMFGAGHGGIEAIIFGVLAAISFFRLLVFRDADLSAHFPIDQLELAKTQIETFWSLPWYAVLMGALERVSAISFHLSASVLVLQVFRRKHILWLFVAIGWHTFLDAAAVYGMQTWGMLVTEAIVFCMGILSVVIIFLLREKSSSHDDVLPPSHEQKSIEIEPQKPSIEHLEDSRYV